MSAEAKTHPMFRLVAYVVKGSPKLKILVYRAHWIRNVHQRQLLVFTDSPLTQLNVEMIQYLLGFHPIGQFHFCTRMRA